MENSKVLKTLLFISGLIATGIGAAILFMPVAFYAGNSIDLGGNINLLNELRASGGGLLAVGILVMFGAFITKLTFTATVISMLMYLAYGMSRIFSIAVDGMPVEGLVMAAVLEIIVGLFCIFAFLKFRENV